MSNLRLFYSSHYDLTLGGLERLHPFDSRKYSRTWKGLHARFGSGLKAICQPTSGAVTDADLRRIHTSDYLASLRSSAVLARALEMPPIAWVPNLILRWRLIGPMRWATQGTIEAAAWAVEHGCAINLAGGYHHAHADHGEGFCLFADVPVAIACLRALEKLTATDKILVIDLDAHRGNGFEAIAAPDSSVHFFDMFNSQVYPGWPRQELRFPSLIGLHGGMDGDEYLHIVKTHLPAFLDAHADAKLVFYNAGTDILSSDPVGRLDVSANQVFERDRYVIDQLDERGLRWVMLPSGGYTSHSHELMQQAYGYAIEKHGNLKPL
jgi:histone deacetylase 11